MVGLGGSGGGGAGRTGTNAPNMTGGAGNAEVFQHLQEKDLMVEMVYNQEIEQVAVVVVPVLPDKMELTPMPETVELEFKS